MSEKPNLEVLIKEQSKEREKILKLDAINDFYKSLIESVVLIGLLLKQR